MHIFDTHISVSTKRRDISYVYNYILKRMAYLRIILDTMYLYKRELSKNIYKLSINKSL